MKTVWKVWDSCWGEEVGTVFATREAAERYVRSILNKDDDFDEMMAREVFDFDEVTVIE